MLATPTIIEAWIDGQEHTVTALPGQLVLEALEDAGLRPPFSCRAGCCATCMCQLLEGEVEMLANNVLDADDLNGGWILACQAVARSGRLKIRYEDPA
jgi:3-ketosteroid 9alpha-monooxygenase subunit B